MLVDGDFVLTESAAIVLYLAEKYGKFLPTDARGRAEVNRWLFVYRDGTGAAALAHRQEPESVPRRHSDWPPTFRSPARIFAGWLMWRKTMRGRKFVAGDPVTVADLVLAYTLDWASEEGLLDGCPSLVAYMERMYARPKAAKRIAQLRDRAPPGPHPLPLPLAPGGTAGWVEGWSLQESVYFSFVSGLTIGYESAEDATRTYARDLYRRMRHLGDSATCSPSP